MLLRPWLTVRLHRLVADLHDRKKKLAQASPSRALIGIALLERMGDIVAAEPIARHIRQRNPNACILWMVRPPYRELVDHHPDLDGVLPLTCLGEVLRLERAKIFDRFYNLHLEGIACPYFGDLLAQPDFGPPHITMANYYQHGSLGELFSHSAGLGTISEGPHLHIPPHVRTRVDALKLPQSYVVFNCGSAEGLRDWPAERFAGLAGRIADTCGWPTLEVGLRAAIAGQGRSNVVDLCARLSILETAEVIARAKLFVGIDSGPAHLANALGVPGVILLGHYLGYKRYMPYCGNYRRPEYAQILHANGPVSTLTVDEVFRTVVEHPALRRSKICWGNG
jgi:heptosyltransferase-3